MLMAEVLAVRQRLPVPGAWAYARQGHVVVCVFDECGRPHSDQTECGRCFSDTEMANHVEWVKEILSFAGSGRPL